MFNGGKKKKRGERREEEREEKPTDEIFSLPQLLGKRVSRSRRKKLQGLRRKNRKAGKEEKKPRGY